MPYAEQQQQDLLLLLRLLVVDKCPPGSLACCRLVKQFCHTHALSPICHTHALLRMKSIAFSPRVSYSGTHCMLQAQDTNTSNCVTADPSCMSTAGADVRLQCNGGLLPVACGEHVKPRAATISRQAGPYS